MSLFKLQLSQLPTQTGFALGSTCRFQIPRDFPMEGFMLRVQPTVSGAAATIAPDGVFALIKSIRLTVNDGGSSRNVINASGMSVIQRHTSYNANVDTATLLAFANAYSTTTAKDITIPFTFAPPSLEDPVRSHFLLNLPRFNSDPVLEIQFGTQVDVDTHATPTFAISALSVTLTTLKRFVKVPNWTYLDTEFFDSDQAYPTNAANQIYNIPVPGFHFALGARPYSSATALGDFTQTGGFVTIQALNTFERRVEPANLLKLDQFSIGSDVTAAGVNGAQRTLASSVYWWDYLSDQPGSGALTLDGVLDTNPFVNVGTGPQVIWDLNGGTGKHIVYSHDRFFGDINPFRYLRPAT
jgi:hypothetical protein